MKEPLLIYGAGGLGKEVLSLVRALDRFEPIGFLDDSLAAGTLVKGVQVLGGVEALKAFDKPVHVVIAFGDPVMKFEAASKIKGPRVIFPVLKHPSVILQDEASIAVGEGSILCAGSVLTTDIRLGAHVLVNLNCTIGHDTTLGSCTSVMPGVNVAGQVAIGNCVLIGSGSSIMNRITIGNLSKIGMGAVVIHDVPERVTAVGVPAKIVSSVSK
ncbi:acetyltransferase [Chryseolinea lacunae]|uniref:Acetyltransferase n=1 Tax=Chryseolinea lacunae TaxID=2801331 RepID=A0ABS1KXI5_9BACT|nr:acetyltransferase [Chryseolinea lacunae]MBL0744008.1 acetyltransferase [Chryseolinea lacunae]